MQNVEHLTRQLDIIPLDRLNKRITIVGAGAIGSFVTLALAKMGFEDISVIDMDSVSPENMNCQWYRVPDIGKQKVIALREIIKDFTNVEIKAIDHRWANGSWPLEGIVISAVDSMRVRKDIWGHVKENWKVSWFIDPRMAAEYARCFVMNPNDPKDQASYEKSLFDDSKGVEERCTAKATMYTATMIAGFVAKQVKDVVTGSVYARVTDWDIGMNNQLTWPKAKGEENATPET